MDSLLNDVEELLRQHIGDKGRLEHIKETLEKNKMLYVSDRIYVTNLAEQHLKQEYKVSERPNYDSSTNREYSYREDSGSTNLQKKFCVHCGNSINHLEKFCTNCGKLENSVISNNQDYSKSAQNPVRARWYLLPIFVGWLGGIIAYLLTRKRNPKRARNMLIVGFIPSMIYLGLFLVVIGAEFSGLIQEQNEIDSVLEKFPENIQEIKKIQLANCENNMAYLQSEEAGDMYRDRCIDSVLGN